MVTIPLFCGSLTKQNTIGEEVIEQSLVRALSLRRDIIAMATHKGKHNWGWLTISDI